MALLADDSRSVEARQYFASFGELASKIVQESENVRSNNDWKSMTYKQKESLIDRHFIDDSVRSYYSGGNQSTTSLGASSASFGGAGADSVGTGDVPLPAWEMLFPRPIPLGGQKFVHVGSGEDGETSAASYVDEFAGNFQWETKSQLELWLPEGKSLPSPRSVRRSMYKDDHRTNVDVKRYSKASDGSDTADGDGASGATSVKAMAKALQRTSGGAYPPPSGSRISGTGLAPIPSNTPTPSPAPAPKASPSLARTQSHVQTKSSPDVAPRPPKRSSSIVGDTPSPQVKVKSTGALAVPPPSKSASYSSELGAVTIDTGDADADAAAAGAQTGGKPRPSPPVRRDSLSKKTGSPYAAEAAKEERDSSTYKPGAVQSNKAPSSAAVPGAATTTAAAAAAAVQPAGKAAASRTPPRVEKPSRAPPAAPPAAATQPPAAAGTTNTTATTPAAAKAKKPETPEPISVSSPATGGGQASSSAIETTFPATPGPLEGFDDGKLLGSANSGETAGGTSFDFLSNW